MITKLRDGLVMGEDWPAVRASFRVGDVVSIRYGYGMESAGTVIKINPAKLRIRKPYANDTYVDVDERYENTALVESYVMRDNIVHKLVRE